jgi:CMP-N,N'-diacetyllegionaminic acid synthase
MNIVGIIPARGGSVGVPLKNIKNFNGKPLIEYTINAAITSKVLDRVIVSTDHKEIARISKDAGAEVPFQRPADISEDVSTELVLKHCINYLENVENYLIDAVVLLQPTSPFRKESTISKAVNLYKNTVNADSVVSVTDIEGNRPEWMMSLGINDYITPYATPFKEDNKPVIKLAARQSFPKLYKMNGVIWVTKRDLLMNKNLVVGPNALAIINDEIEAMDIDTELDFEICQVVMNNMKID